MKNQHSSGRRKRRIIFFALLLLGITGLTFIVTTISQNGDMERLFSSSVPGQPVMPTGYTVLMNEVALLKNQLISLQLLDAQFNEVLASTRNKRQLDSINRRITKLEQGFQASIDSIFLNTPGQPDSSLYIFNDIGSSFKSMLENRHSLSSLRNAFIGSGKGLSATDAALMARQNQLAQKNSRIALLEAQVRASGKNQGTMPDTSAIVNARILPLKDYISRQEKTIKNLTEANNSLIRDNERLVKKESLASNH